MSYTPPRRAHARIRSLRALERAMEDRDVTASELAALSGASKQTISNLRRGVTTRMRVDTATSIEKALRVRPGDLFDFDAQPQGV